MIETIAIIFSLLSVYYSIKKNFFTWIWGIIGIIFYAIFFYNEKLYSNLLLQFIFLSQSIHGIISWKTNNKEGLIVKKMRDYEIFISAQAVLLIFVILSVFNNSILDNITSSISIVALFLLSIRRLENWFFWIVADIIYIYMFYQSSNYQSSILYTVFLIMCVVGYKKWKNALSKNKK